MTNSLLPFTRLVLIVSAVVQFILALVALLAPQLVHTVTWPPPFEPIPVLWMRYDAVTFIAMGLGAVYGLRTNNWLTARTYLLIAGLMVAAELVITLLAAATPPGIPPIAWLYIVLAAIYVPLVFWTWRAQAAQAVSA